MIQVRKASVTDVSQVSKLGQSVPEFLTSDLADNFWPEDILRASVGKGDVLFLVAVENDEVNGFLIVNCNKSLSKALIENIFVKESERGKGIAGQMLEVAKKECNKYRYMSALIPPNDAAAVRAYEKAGFAKGEQFLWLDLTA